MMAINMSYCRFENTYEAPKECMEALGDELDPLSDLSDSEKKYAKRLFKLCRQLADDYAEDA